MDKQYTVMVVEDEKLLSAAIEKKLELSGIKTSMFSDGASALDCLEKNPLPDIIWLDYYLTDMNGLEFVTRLRNNAKWAQIPVIIVSNSANDEKIKTVLALGVKKYMLKAQYRLEEIIHSLKQILFELHS
jgi:CheY-like chemotaxis protein